MSNDPFGPMDTMWGVADSLSNMTSSAMNKRLLTRQIGAKLAKGQKDKAENEALGPCIVNIGSPRINRVRIEPPQNKPTNSGTSYTHYTMTLFNKGGILLIEFVGEIGICDYREPYEMNSVTEMVNFTEPDLKRRKGYRHIETFEKSIDGREGAITIGQGSGTIPDIVSFQYIRENR